MNKAKASFIKRVAVRICILTATLSILVACGKSDKKSESFNVGVLNIAPPLDVAVTGFKEKMLELGYVEGENITYIYNGAVDISDLSAEAEKLIAADVDLIFCITTPASLAAHQATNDIPIVFTLVTDPVGSGLVEDWAQTGNNITGVSDGGSEHKRLEWLVQIVPDIHEIYFPYNPNNPAGVASFSELSEVAPSLNITLLPREVRDQEEVQQAIADIPDEADAIYLPADSTATLAWQEWANASIRHRIPWTQPNRIEQGPLLTFHADIYASGEQAARLVHQVLSGTPVNDLPVERADFYLSINLQTADAIGLEISDSILRQADYVITLD